MTPMQCPACATGNRPGVKFCEECGARLPVACPACGARVPAGGKFCGECGAPLAGAEPAAGRFGSPQSYTPAHLAERILRDRSALTGERKQVTVLFADVSGFTSLSERLDPEDVHALINRTFEVMLAEVHRYEGTVNQFLGDGLMALFGAPIAHEDHARRAALAGLGMQRALGRLRETLLRERGVDFRVRMGLNTGLVVVGAIGDNLRMDYTAVGDTTNIAARMQQHAEPGRIVVAEGTERLIAPYFETRPLGMLTLKNRAAPVAAHELVRARADVSRLAARTARGLSPFVGRDDALATLERAWALARAGHGQVALVVGEAGLGKSRLLLEFRRRVGDDATWVEGDCISFGRSVLFLPIVDMLKRNFGIDDQDAEADIVAKVRRGVAVVGDDAARVEPYLRYLLAVDPGDPAVAAMDPAVRRARIVGAIQRLTAAGARRRPIVLVVEDAHWIDAASEDCLRSLADAVPGMAVLLVITHRPLDPPPFGDRTYYWRITLRPVDAGDATRIVRATLGLGDLADDVAGTIAARAEGNPFFLEEIGHTLVETGAVRVEGGQLVVAPTASVLMVPATVQDVIAARLDRLEEPQKRTVQTASVIGREFALGLLQRVSDLQHRLAASLAELKRIELIYEKLGSADLEYVFRHALTQDVAYASLLQSERRRLHALIGAAIEQLHAGRLDERTEELVHHFSRGEVWDKVVRYAREAAERAAALCVDDRAVELYRTALDALAHLPETPAAAEAGVDIRLAMRAPLWRGGHPDALHALFEEAEALATRHGLGDRLDTVYAFLVQYHWAKGDQDRALDYGRRCLERAKARDDLGLRVTGHFYLSHAYHALGQYAAAVDEANEVLRRLDGPRRHERFGLSGLPYSGACAIAAESLAELGDEHGALATIRRGQEAADAADHLYSQMAVAAAHGHVLTSVGRPQEAIAMLEPAAATCRRRSFVGQLINALRHLGHAYLAADRPADALPPLRESIELQERARVSVTRGSQLTTLAEAHLALGDLDAAEARLAEALAFVERQGERGAEAWARLASARLAHRRGDRARAVRMVEEAEEIAEELAMRPLLEQCRALTRALG
jgi:class 3 adenylate cyclase/tetratricopeptide (TPR) repeat protein